MRHHSLSDPDVCVQLENAASNINPLTAGAAYNWVLIFY